MSFSAFTTNHFAGFYGRLLVARMPGLNTLSASDLQIIA